MRTVAVLLAAGRSERFGEDKLRLQLNGVPIWRRSYNVLASHPLVSGVGIVASEALLEQCRKEAPGALFVVKGGDTRTESAKIGLANLPRDAESVLFHDAARPFVKGETVSAVIDAVGRSGAAFPGVQVTDTIKTRDDGAYRTLERDRLVAVQTPQGAKVELFRRAFVDGAEASDDMALLERIGVSPEYVVGDPSNVKITMRSDLPLNTETRTGIGYDIHRFSADAERPLWLGGVRFDGPGLEGHSDADAVLHAVVDAILGAAGLGDIGEHYPNTDPRWKDEPSATFLIESTKKALQLGWAVVNIDISVLAERPRLAERRDEIRSVIAALVGIDEGRISVKATTNEGLGAIGRGEGVAAFAVATLAKDA